MKNNHLSSRVKELRNQKGMSQENLAEESGLSLRTIQRIENGETNPTGETLKRLSGALNMDTAELYGGAIKEDKRYLIYLNLSALTFVFFPLFGIITPFLLWSERKDKSKSINKTGRDLINFEITWTIVLFLIPVLLMLFMKIGLLENLTIRAIITITAIMYFLNMLLVVINALRISNEQEVVYYSIIKLLR